MIIQSCDSNLLLIAQVDHAALAARIMTAWRANGLPERPARACVLEATRQHDVGWRVFDASPGLDAQTGMPYDVVNAPLDVRQGALDRLAPQDP
jgi:hypothetical protein